MSRLDAPAQAPAKLDPAQRPHPCACLECGGPHAAAAAEAEFCSAACRGRFNNRRATRGAELYDLFMAHRFDRRAAQALGVLAILNRAASLFREQDRRERAGRPSWRPAAAVIARRPYLRARRLWSGRTPA